MPVSLPVHACLGLAARWIALLFVMVGGLEAADQAQNVNLAWNANPESDISGYRVLYGLSSGVLTQSQSVSGTTPYATLANLEVGKTYYCAVRAISAKGIESSSSPEISFIVSPVAAPEINVADSGSGNLSTGGGLGFGQIETGSGSATRTLTISNSGDAPLTGLGLSIDGSSSASFGASGLSRTTLAPGESVSFSLSFTPSSGGSISAGLRIASNDADENPFDLALTGTGIEAPEIVVENQGGVPFIDGESTLNLLNPAGSGGGELQTLVIRNAGKGLLSGISISIDGANASDFQINYPSSGSLSSGGSSTFQVLFSPSGAGVKTAKLHIASNDTVRGTFDLNLVGNGTPAPDISVRHEDGNRLVSGSTTMSFATTPVGVTGSPQALVIENLGQAPLGGLRLSIDGTNAGDFSFESPAATSVAPAAGVSFRILFKPLAAGNRQAVLHIASNDPDEASFDIPLTGSAVTVPDITVAASGGQNLVDGAGTLSFGSQTLGSVGNTLSLAIGNTGTGPLASIAASIDGANAGDFTITTVPSGSLAAGANTTLGVTFKPLAAGTRSATLRIASNDPDENPFEVILSGTGVALPEISVLRSGTTDLIDGTSTLSFGTVDLGASSTQETLVIKNTGTANLTGLALSVSGTATADFKTGSLAVTSLAPGASTSVTVSFVPLVAGARSATLSIASNDADENPFEIGLSGTGLALPEIAITGPDTADMVDGQSSVDFPEILVGNTSTAKTFVIRNAGTAVLNGLSVSMAGTHSPDFTVTSLATTSLSPGASTTFQVTFQPSGAGSRSAILRVASNDADENPFDIALTGIGIAVPEITLKGPDGANMLDGISPLDFSNVPLGSTPVSKTLTVSNTGTAILSGISAGLAGVDKSDFIVSALPASLAPGASGQLTITFTPSTAGPKNAQLAITSNDADENPFDIALMGSGVPVPIITTANEDGTALPDTGIAFGDVNLGNEAVPRRVVIKNIGTAALDGLTISVGGTSTSDYPVTATSPVTSLAPGESTSFSVAFRPASAGQRAASVLISGTGQTPVQVRLNGKGIAVPRIGVTGGDGQRLVRGHATANFGKVKVGVPAARTFTIVNTGTAALTHISLAITGPGASDFKLSSPGSNRVAPGAKTTFKVSFDPTKGVVRKATVSIASNDPEINPFIVDLEGTGETVAEITVKQGNKQLKDNGALNYGPVKGTRSMVVTVTNTGSAALSGLSVSRKGVNAADFSVGKLKASSLAPGKSLDLKITFNPGSDGIRWGSLHISSNAPDEPVFDIILTGKGSSKPVKKKKKALARLALFATRESEADLPSGPVRSWAMIGGKKYRTLAIPLSPGSRISSSDIEVSSNLLDWYRGSKHTTVLVENGVLLKVRDNTATSLDAKRYIRIRKSRD